jgi:glycosyltransferase involved in cell wall biosynthesis
MHDRIISKNSMPKAKITYLIGHLATGGAESQLVEILHNLDRSRFEPSLILLTSDGTERADGLVDYVDAIKPVSGKMNPLHSILRIASTLKEIKPAILHALLPEPCILGFAAAKLRRVPILVGSRLSLVDCYRPNHSWPVVAADRLATTVATHMIGNSNAIGDELANLDQAPPSKISVIYNGIDVKRFNPALSPSLREEFGWNSTHIVFGCVANFFGYKRQVDLVAAAEAIVNEFPQARFLLLGEDRGTMAEVRQAIARRGLSDFFAIIPGRPDPESVYAAIDVYVCTSDTEGFSNVILEAMSCGKPVIATNVGGNGEAVIDGQSGILIPRRSPDSLAGAAKRLLQSPELRLSMGNFGRKRVEEHFSVRTMVSAHEELYSRLLESSGN